jgi:hypothetical protein
VENCREVVIGVHRADIRATEKHTASTCVVELQHSPIDREEIQERETFYGSMFWVIDGIGFRDNFEFGRESRTNGGATLEAPFRWKWFRKSWSGSQRRLYLDFGDRLWLITEMNSEGRGKAQSWTYHEFLAQFGEALGKDVPVKWIATSSGSHLYRFGLGHVLLTEKEGLYRIGIYRYKLKRMVWRRDACRTLDEAKSLCEANMGKLMEQG